MINSVQLIPAIVAYIICCAPAIKNLRQNLFRLINQHPEPFAVIQVASVNESSVLLNYAMNQSIDYSSESIRYSMNEPFIQ